MNKLKHLKKKLIILIRIIRFKNKVDLHKQKIKTIMCKQN